MLRVTYTRGRLVWREVMDIDNFLKIFDNENYKVVEVIVLAD